MGILKDATRDARALADQLERADRLLNLPAGRRGGRSGSPANLRRIEGALQRIDRKLGKGGGAGGDPFLADLLRGTGPRRA